MNMALAGPSERDLPSPDLAIYNQLTPNENSNLWGTSCGEFPTYPHESGLWSLAYARAMNSVALRQVTVQFLTILIDPFGPLWAAWGVPHLPGVLVFLIASPQKGKPLMGMIALIIHIIHIIPNP